ncbi:MAG: hypothetical protein FD155_2519 [Bacteroidetes bacterium]|nr:MAG: hypothetical protein FD155_2519 [Bacteroidota bacterium]
MKELTDFFVYLFSESDTELITSELKVQFRFKCAICEINSAKRREIV